jgi:four helix bundle protein
MHFFKDLIVWQKAMALTVKIYTITNTFPPKEQFGLISQINRSAVSIPVNIAEGCGRHTDKDFKHYLSIALGSGFELETLLIIANKVTHLDAMTFQNLSGELQEIQKMLVALHNKN